MTISVIVPTFNDGDRIEACLAALAAQTMRCQVIVVDNGSDTPPVELCRQYGARLLHESTPGSYAARNKGLDAVSSGVVAFTDSDCIPAPDWLEQATNGLRDEVVVGRVRATPRNPTRPTLIERYEMLRAFPVHQYIQDHYGVTANLVTRRSVIDRVGPFDATLRSGGDKDWCQRAHAAGFPVRYAPQAIVCHPARRRFRELASKYRRIEGGEHARDSGGRRWRALVQKWLLWPIPPVRFLIGFKRDGTAATWRDILLIGWVLQGLRFVRATERTRLCFGGTPRR